MHTITDTLVVWGAFALTALALLGALAVASHRINNQSQQENNK